MIYREADPPLEADRSILVVGLNGAVVGLDRETGAIRWKNPLVASGGHEVFIAFRFGLLVVSAAGDQLISIDYRNGLTRWASPTQSAGRATILIEHDRVVCAKGGYLDCFDHDGRALWSQPLTGLGLGAIALAFPGNVAQADQRG